MSIIYGVDTDKTITPELVRDAIVECFYQAHFADAGADVDNPQTSREYCEQTVARAFSETQGDFSRPNKESIMAAVKHLAELAQNFRDPQLVEKHFGEIMELVAKL